MSNLFSCLGSSKKEDIDYILHALTGVTDPHPDLLAQLNTRIDEYFMNGGSLDKILKTNAKSPTNYLGRIMKCITAKEKYYTGTYTGSAKAAFCRALGIKNAAEKALDVLNPGPASQSVLTPARLLSETISDNDIESYFMNGGNLDTVRREFGNLASNDQITPERLERFKKCIAAKENYYTGSDAGRLKANVFGHKPVERAQNIVNNNTVKHLCENYTSAKNGTTQTAYRKALSEEIIAISWENNRPKDSRTKEFRLQAEISKARAELLKRKDEAAALVPASREHKIAQLRVMAAEAEHDRIQAGAKGAVNEVARCQATIRCCALQISILENVPKINLTPKNRLTEDEIAAFNDMLCLQPQIDLTRQADPALAGEYGDEPDDFAVRKRVDPSLHNGLLREHQLADDKYSAIQARLHFAELYAIRSGS